MGFIIKQISDVGVTNPIVARLSLQFNDILSLYELSDEKKKEIRNVLYSDIQKRLLVCEKIANELSHEIISILKKLQTEGVKIQSGGRVIESPHIIGLEEQVENYLYNAKSCLRDALKIYNIVFESDFSEARYDKAIKWATKQFGEEDHLTKFLEADHKLWIHKLVKMRNAIEHPGGHSGRLKIHNFKVTQNKSKINIAEPCWGLNDHTPTLIRADIHVFIHNILELTEDIVLSALEKLGKTPMLAIIEIPNEQRNEEAPIRFKIGLVQ